MHLLSQLIKISLPFCLFSTCQLTQTALAQSTSKEIPTAAPEEVGMSSTKLNLVNEIMQGYVENRKMVGGIVIVASKGKVCFFESYGLADQENDRPMKKDSILRFYSMTKSIITAAALMLHDEGKLNVNDPVSKYIPELADAQIVTNDGMKPAQNIMTIADLMRHTSGLTYGGSKNVAHNLLHKKYEPTNHNITLSEMPARLKKIQLAFEPSTGWEYGISIDVLGRVIEVASGKSLEEFFNQRLLSPLDMRDTGFHVPAEKLARFAACYEPKDGGFKLKEQENEKFLKSPVFKSGGGGLVSTARDYMRFLMMIQQGGELEGRRYLKPETVKLMTTNRTPLEAGWVHFGEVREGVGFGFGFNVRDKMSEWDPGGRVGEYGWGGAASTHFWVSPKDDLIVITLEQIRPYRWLTEFGLKKVIYDAIEK